MILFWISAAICGLVYLHQKLTFLGLIEDTDQRYEAAKGWAHIGFAIFLIGALIVLL